MALRVDDGISINLRERAYRGFTRHLLDRDLKPGQFVSQRELAELTAMPLGAIRELIPRLEVEGLIRTVPQRGLQIAHVDLHLVRDAYQFRLCLEKEAIALFVETASDGEIAGLRAQHEAVLAQAREQGNSPEVVARAQTVDWGLHDTLIDALGNKIITQAHRVNSIKIRLIRQELCRIDGLVAPVMEEHLKIIDAIAARNRAAAVEALAGHILDAQRRATGLR